MSCLDNFKVLLSAVVCYKNWIGVLTCYV